MTRFLNKKIIILLLVFMSGACVSFAGEEGVQLLAATARDFEQQKDVFWQQINLARKAPLDVVRRLGLNERDVRAALGRDAWILDRGLPPLAKDGQLTAAATGHAGDMLSRLYYNHTTPEGEDSAQRIARTGYSAVFQGETLGLLAFSGYISPEFAVKSLLDSLMRDELKNTVGVQRNIFSPHVSEIGFSIKGETIRLLPGQPYVYLLVANFAQPLESREFIVGMVDVDNGLMIRSLYSSFWRLVAIEANGSFQMPYPEGGGDVVALNEAGRAVSSQFVDVGLPGVNYFLDLRQDSL